MESGRWEWNFWCSWHQVLKRIEFINLLSIYWFLFPSKRKSKEIIRSQSIKFERFFLALRICIMFEVSLKTLQHQSSSENFLQLKNEIHSNWISDSEFTASKTKSVILHGSSDMKSIWIIVSTLIPIIC